MLGTLNGALEVRNVKMAPESIAATVRGINEIKDGLPVLTKIEIEYALRIPPGSRDTVDRALERHQSKCPTAQSIKESVTVSWTADVRENAPPN